MKVEANSLEIMIVAYAPNAISGIQVNVGVIVVESCRGEIYKIKARFISDVQLILNFDPHADLQMLRSLFSELESRLELRQERQETLRLIEETFSNTIRISERKAVHPYSSVEDELKGLFNTYVLRSTSSTT